MKKSALFILLICLLGNVSGVFAQRGPSEKDRKDRFEKFRAEREAVISKAMQLTDDEKKAFWPLCNELQIKKFELNKTLRDEMRQIGQARRDKQAVTEANYKKVVELSARVKVQEAELELEYLNRFLHVLPAEKVFLYRQSEQSFGEKMIRDRAGRDKDRAEIRAKRDKDRAELRVQRDKDLAEIRAQRGKDLAEIQALVAKIRPEIQVKMAEFEIQRAKLLAEIQAEQGKINPELRAKLEKISAELDAEYDKISPEQRAELAELYAERAELRAQQAEFREHFRAERAKIRAQKPPEKSE
jgi:Spy/CpxP family protein refolding chaperone